MKFTEEQLKVINSDGDLLVSASAGCGKTTVMLQRVLRLLREGTPLTRMLITTFTNAAAADMRSKLNSLLRAEYDKTKEPFIKAQYESLPSADISTLHTWCLKLIRKYFFVTGDDPAFDIASEAQAKTWRREAIDRAIEEFAAKEELGEFFETYTARRKTSKIFSIAHDLIEFAAAQADGEQWLSSAADHYESAEVRAYVEDSAMWSLINLERLFNSFEMSAKAAGLWDKAASYVDALRCSAAGDEVPLPRAVGITAIKGEYDALKKSVLKMQESQLERLSFRADEARVAAKIFVEIARTAAGYYSEKKAERGQLDFNDLEQGAKAIMQSSYGEEIRRGYDYIFIDEYQDINPLQESIIKLLKGDNTMFFVGDIKQSIYSFRNCSPAAFSAKIKELPASQVLLLNSNFRCSSGILAFCNNVFSRVMTKDFGQVDYLGDAMFDLAGGIDDDSVEIITIPEKEETEKQTATFDEVYSVRAAAQQDEGKDYSNEAVAAASKVLQLAQHTITENGVSRPAAYDDIVIIVRSRGGCVTEIADILKSAGVPVCLSRDLSLTSSRYARDLLSYLRLIDNRRDDISLVGAMRSYFGGFTDNELTSLRLGGGSGSFYTCVRRAAEQNVKVSEFLSTLDKYTLMSRGIAPGELAGRITAEFDYFKYIIGQEDGMTHSTAVSALLDKMNSFEGCLSDWLEYLGEVELEADGDASGGSVRIMTTHASKGLEFPFVVLCNLGKRFNTGDIKDGICDSQFGLALMSRSREQRKKFPTDAHYAAKIKKEHANKEEELRILYVAMTRAKYKLVLLLPDTEENDALPQSVSRASDWLLPHAKAWGMKPHMPLPELAPVLPPDKLNQRTLEALKQSAAELKLPPLIPIKSTVTALAHQSYDETAPRVKVLHGGAEDAIEHGNAYHKALELFDYSRGTSQITDLLMQIENGHMVDATKLGRLSDMMQGRLGGRKFYREQMFIYRAGGSITEGESMIVQGVIDMLIVDGPECEIIDYKTGHLDDNKINAYRRQLDIYADAVEKTLGFSVTKKTILSVDGEKFIDYK